MSIEVVFPVLLAIFASALTISAAWRWRGDKYLCDDCKFNNDEDCRKEERPLAISCLAYRKQKQAKNATCMTCSME